jgi:hypothetical protein
MALVQSRLYQGVEIPFCNSTLGVPLWSGGFEGVLTYLGVGVLIGGAGGPHALRPHVPPMSDLLMLKCQLAVRCTIWKVHHLVRASAILGR